MTLFQLYPIDQTDNLPDGWYITIRDAAASKTVFHNGRFAPNLDTHYLRPVHDVVVLTREQAGKIWEAAKRYTQSAYPFADKISDQQTYIDQLFKEKK